MSEEAQARVVACNAEPERRLGLDVVLAELHVVLEVCTCVEIKILRRVRAESPRRPPRHRRDACSMAWRCRLLAARPSQDGRVIVEKRLSEELSGAPDALVDFHTGPYYRA